jgi:PAS domain S-box-containing protein
MHPVTEPTFQAMLDAAPDAIVGVREDGVIVMANIQTETVFGYVHPDLLGRSVELLVPDSVRDLHPSHRDAYFREPRTRPMGIGLALTGRRADGTEFPAEISLSSIETEDGTVALAAIRDVTDRKRADVAMQDARAEADRAAAALRVTNRELESFSYAVAHDLRAPLRAIDGFSQALVEDADALGDAARADLDRIRRNVHAMSEMIDGLLGLSRLTRSPLELTDVDLSAIAQEAGATLREVEPDRRVELVVEPGISARADANLLRLMMVNLLANAWKFTSPHDRARIEFGADVIDGTRTFFVRDDGVGFDARYVDKLFIPFQRLHRAEDFPGSGIGLATVDRIVRRHGGEISAESSPGEGATFRFTLEAGR